MVSTVNKTDRVLTLDIDGNIVHSFQGEDWNSTFPNQPENIALLKNEGAFRIKIVNRRKEVRGFEYL